MTRATEARERAIAVFPFLKTTAPVKIGSFEFRSTDDRDGLTAAESVHVEEIAAMLFLKDDLRIRTASYAMLSPIRFENGNSVLRELEHVQSIVAYRYSTPHPTLGDVFLSSEHASVAIFSPERVSAFLVRPHWHVDEASELPSEADESNTVLGYQGRYNFQEHFWVAKGSRLYPPIPHPTLNIGQDLAKDLSRRGAFSSNGELLLGLLHHPASPMSERVLTALVWYKRANSSSAGNDSATLCLAVAFESLLALPRDAKTDRFVDAVSLILGRIPRLTTWATQFYQARSDIAHEGRARLIHFVPGGSKKPDSEVLAQPLLVYGRQIFRLCVGALLYGARLAEEADLQNKLRTNQERLELISRELSRKELSPAARLSAVEETVTAVEEYRFAAETGLRIETLIGAARLAAKSFIDLSDTLDPALKVKMAALAASGRTRDSFEALEAIQAAQYAQVAAPEGPRSPQAIAQRVVGVVWEYTFMHFFWLKEERRRGKSNDKDTGPTESR